jgi:hypothetical protein
LASGHRTPGAASTTQKESAVEAADEAGPSLGAGRATI